MKVLKGIGKVLKTIGLTYLVIDIGYLIYKFVKLGPKEALKDIGDTFDGLSEYCPERN